MGESAGSWRRGSASQPVLVDNKIAKPIGERDGELLTLPDVARWLCLSRSSIYYLVERRRIPFIRVGGVLRFTRDDIRAFLARGRVEPIG